MWKSTVKKFFLIENRFDHFCVCFRTDSLCQACWYSFSKKSNQWVDISLCFLKENKLKLPKMFKRTFRGRSALVKLITGRGSGQHEFTRAVVMFVVLNISTLFQNTISISLREKTRVSLTITRCDKLSLLVVIFLSKNSC